MKIKHFFHINSKFHIHFSFFLALPVFYLLSDLKYVLLYFIVLLLHETCHFVVARKLGYVMEKIIVYPFGVALFGETDEFSFKDDILISIAGPFFNFVCACFCIMLWWIEPTLYYYTNDFCVVSFVCAFFNLLPFFPLDGGRVLLATLSCFMNRKNAVRIVRFITILFAFLLFLIFIISFFFIVNFSFGVMAFLLVFSAFNEDKKTRFIRVLGMKFKKKRLKNGLKEQCFVFDAFCTLGNALKKISTSHYTILKIVDKNFCLVRELDETQFIVYLEKYGSHITFAEVFKVK